MIARLSITLRHRGRSRYEGPLAGLIVAATGALSLALPGPGWSPFSVLPAPAGFALALTAFIGAFAAVLAQAIGTGRALRPALHAAILAGLLAPASFAAPLWPATIAAIGLLLAPVRARENAANDNPVPAHRRPHPFSLAA